MTPHIMDPATPVPEDEIEDEGYMHTPVPTDHSYSGSPPPLRRRMNPPFLGSNLILNLAENHPLPSLWSPQSDSTGDEATSSNLRYHIPFPTALLDITNTYWSDAEDDNATEYYGDDESEDNEEDGDGLMVYLVESNENIPISRSLAPVTPLPRINGNPSEYADDADESSRETSAEESSVEQGYPDYMEGVGALVSSSEDDEHGNEEESGGNSSSLNLPMQVQEEPMSIIRNTERSNRYLRRHSLYSDAFGKEPMQRRVMSFHRRHSMSEIMIAHAA